MALWVWFPNNSHKVVYSGSTPDPATIKCIISVSGLAYLTSTQKGRVQILYDTPIWVGSKSATASDCKSDSFGNSEIDTHPAHHFHVRVPQ